MDVERFIGKCGCGSECSAWTEDVFSMARNGRVEWHSV